MVASDKQQLLARAEIALNTIRPHFEVDRGDVEVVDLTDDMILQIRWMGMCQSCDMKMMTLRGGIFQTVRSMIPEIQDVEAVN